MIQYSLEAVSSGERVKFELDLSKFETKSDLENPTGV